MTDNLYCPGCSQRSDSVTALIQHLDMCEHDLRYKMKTEILTDKLRRGGKEPEIKMDLLLVRDRGENANSFGSAIFAGPPQASHFRVTSHAAS